MSLQGALAGLSALNAINSSNRAQRKADLYGRRARILAEGEFDRIAAVREMMESWFEEAEASGMFDVQRAIKQAEADQMEYDRLTQGNTQAHLKTAGYKAGDSVPLQALIAERRQSALDLNRLRLRLPQEYLRRKFESFLTTQTPVSPNAMTDDLLGVHLGRAGMQQQQVGDPSALLGSIMPYLKKGGSSGGATGDGTGSGAGGGSTGGLTGTGDAGWDYDLYKPELGRPQTNPWGNPSDGLNSIVLRRT